MAVHRDVGHFERVWRNEEIKETPLEQSLDVLLTTVTLVGLIAYAVRFQGRTMVKVWKFIAPLILIGYVLQFASVLPDKHLMTTANSSLIPPMPW